MHRILLLFIFLFSFSVYGQQNNATNRQVVLQAFWWDFTHPNFERNWSDYLARLAPRLKELGIDAVWIPPAIKNPGPWVGYSPFDHYDLGDKHQKGYTETALGDKDQLLRMIAVFKANGIDVLGDIGLNHVDGAGSKTGAGGQDPTALDDGTTQRFKNFRYSSYETPGTHSSATNYLSRTGRFPKNWQNFYPSPVAGCCTNDQNSVFWGPDVAYESGSYGESSNAIHNPVQEADYMRNQTREWLIWMKKQTGMDGFRLDAVKHFPAYVTEDMLWNLQNNAGFASGGTDMWAVGEYVDGGSALDQWTYDIQDRAGTFDFKLRFALSNMVGSLGAYDLGSIVNEQQSSRNRTSPFVNNHDTYRPQLDQFGNYNGWNTGSELSPHIEPLDPRSSVCHAITMAMDGSPLVFFEDLFLIGYDSSRYTHDPTDPTELKLNEDVANLIWCHQNLRFKEGAYLVRWQAQDALVIERENRALIAVNDHFTQWQNLTGVQTAFPDGTQLKDYSGANGTAVRTVYGGGRVDIDIPPCNGSAINGRRGYAVWAPVGINTNYVLPANQTIQEWEMANDLGDIHPSSLLQSGALPDSSTECRKAGAIYPKAGEQITVEVFAEDTLAPVNISIWNNTCGALDSLTGTAPFAFTYTPTQSDWHNLIIRNATDTTPMQKAWVKATYMGVDSIPLNTNKTNCNCVGNTWPGDTSTGKEDALENESKTHVFPNPGNSNFTLLSDEVVASYRVIDLNGKLIEQGSPGTTRITIQLDVTAGMYFLHGETVTGKTIRHKLLVKP